MFNKKCYIDYPFGHSFVKIEALNVKSNFSKQDNVEFFMQKFHHCIPGSFAISSAVLRGSKTK
jgi:hypothetical protein